MRRIVALLTLALVATAAGCPPDGRFNLLRPNDKKPPAIPTEAPSAENLVNYLNNVSANIPGIQSDDISLTCYTGGPVGIPVSGKLRAQGPRLFRLTAEAMGNEQVDLGSNNQEFWYRIHQADKYQVFCSYGAIEQGRVKHMPFPFQPDWILEAMGMGKFGPADKYEVVAEGQTYKVIERTKSPQGTPVKKIIVFKAKQASTKPADRCEPQITDYLLVEEATNKLICSAHVSWRQIIDNRDNHSAAELPREMELRWPAQQLKLVLRFNRLKLNNQLDNRFFARPRLNGVPSLDLATGQFEGLHHASGPNGTETNR